MNHWWSWLALLFALEFFYYWMHRADHRVQWLWATHAVHHSSNAYNLSAAYRLGWTSGISGGFLFFAPLVWIGFPVQAVLVTAALNLLYQFWLHTELVPRLGPARMGSQHAARIIAFITRAIRNTSTRISAAC